MDEGQGPAAARPLWRKIVIAMVISIAAMVVAGLVSTWLLGLLPMDGTLLSTFTKASVTVLVALLAYKLVVARVGERPRDDLAFIAAGLRDLVLGTLGGAALFSAVVAVAALLGVYRLNGIDDPRELLFAILVFGLVPAVTEEIVARGILFRFLEEFAGSWAALIITSALFGLAHYGNPGATLFSSATIALEAGVLLGGAYMLTRNLWLAVGLHGGWNATQGGLYGLPVSGLPSRGFFSSTLSGDPLLSGGSFGLEASLIAVVLVTGAGAWLVVLARRRGHVVGPWWVTRRVRSEEAAAPLPA